MASTLDCSCGKTWTIKPEWAGRRVRCPNCQAILEVPEAAPQVAGASTYEIADEPAAAKPEGGPCPNCGQALPATARLCVQCGFDIDSGVVRKLATDDDGADEEQEATTAGAVLGFLAGYKRWIIVGVVALGAIGLVWYGIYRLAHPDSGPFKVTFVEHGELQMRVFWHSLMLPANPDAMYNETEYQVSGWKVVLPDNTSLKPAWKSTSFQNTVNVMFMVPRSTTIKLMLGENHVGEVQTPAAGPHEESVVLRWTN